MKHFVLKKLIATVLVLCMCAGNLNMIIYAAENEMDDDYVFEVAPYNVAIMKRSFDFFVSEDGKAMCFGEVSVRLGYTVELIMQLQKKASMWTTVQSWNDTDTNFVTLDEEYSLDKGYTYRLMLVYNAYDSEGNRVESFYDMSDVVEYK